MKKKMYNLLDDVLSVLSDNNISELSARWVGGSTYKTTWEQFKYIADRTDYTDVSQLPVDLVIFGNGWYITVGEDNYDRLVLTDIPKEPSTAKSIVRLSTYQTDIEDYPYLDDLG